MRNSRPALYDLHLHTYWSFDGSNEPEAYLRRASELGVRCIAITDHHNTDSFDEVRQLSTQYPEVRVIRAAELSVTTAFGSVDLLCYGLPEKPTGAFAEVLEEICRWQEETGVALSRGMQALGYPFGETERLELLKSYRPARVVERQGVMSPRKRAMVEYFVRHGWVADMEEYTQLIRSHPEEFRFPPYLQAERVTTAVKQAGGLVVIAHPARYLGRDKSRMEALREECSLDGLECAHPTVSPELTAFYRNYCRERGLLSTGGSDSHRAEAFTLPEEGWGYTPKARFASHLGEAEWFDEFLERL